MRVSIRFLLASALISAGLWVSTGWGDEQKTDPPPCSGAGCQAERCECAAGEKCEGCPCATCSSDENCECIALLREGTGKIRGVVKNRWAKRFPMVVYIDRIDGKVFAPPTKKEAIDQTKLTFTPRVLPILVGTTVIFKNNDSVTHNVFSPSGEKYDLGNWDEGQTRDHTFEKPGAYTQLCKLHAEMVAYIVVVETPYFAKTSIDDQSFEIRNVPPGKYRLKVWGERLKKKQLKFSQEVKIAAGADVQVTLKP